MEESYLRAAVLLFLLATAVPAAKIMMMLDQYALRWIAFGLVLHVLAALPNEIRWWLLNFANGKPFDPYIACMKAFLAISYCIIACGCVGVLRERWKSGRG